MRSLAFLVPILVVSTLASPFLSPSVSAGTEILRRQDSTGDTCATECDDVQRQATTCGDDVACLCTAAIAQGMQTCASCKLAADPSGAPSLQTFLNQYVSGCQANGHPVGNLTLTGSAASALPTATQSIAAGSSKPTTATPTAATPTTATPTAATPTSSSTRNGNSASVVGVQPVTALIAAGMTLAFGFL